jgi:hypothetical protein
MKIASLTAALLFAFAGSAAAVSGGIDSIKAEPNPAKVGQPVKITVSGDTAESTLCGLLTIFGDGKDERSSVGGKDGPFPKTATYAYAKPGTYIVKAEGRKVGMSFGCPGTAEARLVVEAAPAAAAPAKAAATGPACPEGYALKGKAGKKGDFTCSAGKGAKKPEKVMDCADGLEYFQTKTTLGCRKVGKK